MPTEEIEFVFIIHRVIFIEVNTYEVGYACIIDFSRVRI